MMWMSKVYNSRYSRKLRGYIHVEASSRNEALAILAKLAESSALPHDAAAMHGREAMGGVRRHTLVRCIPGNNYLASDGTWRKPDGTVFYRVKGWPQ